MADFVIVTKYLPLIEHDVVGHWVIDCHSEGTLDSPMQMPYISYSEMVCEFEEAIYKIKAENEALKLVEYRTILNQRGIDLEHIVLSEIDVERLDIKGVLALLMAAVRAERFCEGTLLRLFKNGTIKKWLLKLEALDNSEDYSAINMQE